MKATGSSKSITIYAPNGAALMTFPTYKDCAEHFGVSVPLVTDRMRQGRLTIDDFILHAAEDECTTYEDFEQRAARIKRTTQEVLFARPKHGLYSRIYEDIKQAELAARQSPDYRKTVITEI